MKLRNVVILLATLMALATPAFALDLHQARASGLVGEKLDGYVAPIKVTPEVQALVQEINAKRKLEYARISAENKQPVNVVAKLAAEQIIKNLDPGSYYQEPGGTWKTR